VEEKMKTKESFLFGCMIVVALAGCAIADDKAGQQRQTQRGTPQAERPAAAVTKVAPASDFPVVGYLEGRGQTITIKAGPKGPVYSAKTTEGKVLFENLSAEQLRAQAPELYQFIKTAVASGSGQSGVFIDASLRLSSPDGRMR
jgi:hypothetical protein